MNVVAPGITIQDYETGKAKPIDLFEGQIKHWILAFARHLAHQHNQREDAGIAVLLLASAALEPLGGVLPIENGGKGSKFKFCNGFVRVFPEVPGATNASKVAERVYELLRNGLFHEAFIKAGIVLTRQDTAVLEKDGVIYVDSVRFFDAVDSEFSDICNEIRSAGAGARIRQSFDYYWNEKQDKQSKALEPIIERGAEYPPVCSTNTLAPVNLNKWLTLL